MAVPASQRRLIQHRLGQDLAKGNYHVEIGLERRQLLLTGEIVANAFRGEDRNVNLQSCRLHGRRHHLFPASAPTVRLGDYTDNGVPRCV